MFSRSYMCRFIFILFIAFFSVTAMAAKIKGKIDPVGWSLSPSTGFPAATSINNTYTVIYTFTNTLPFAKSLTVNRASSDSDFRITHECQNEVLSANGGTCTVDISFTPNTTGEHNIQLIMSYDKNVVPLPTLTTTSSGSSGVDTLVTGSVTGMPEKTYTGSTYSGITYTFQNHSASATSPTNTVSVTVTPTSAQGEFSQTSNTCNSSMAANGTCTIVGTFTPTADGSKTLTATYDYLSDGTAKSTPVPASTTTSTSSGSCENLTGTVQLPLPTTTYQYGDNVVKVVFTNACTATAAQISTVTTTATAGSATVTQGTGDNDTCTNQIVPAGGTSTCTVYTSVIPTATTGTNGLTVTTTATYKALGSSGATTTSTGTTIATVAANDSTDRMITFVNQCPFQVWMTFVGAADPDTTKTCNPGSCASYETCTNHVCYFNNPTVSGDGLLAAQVSGSAPSTMNVTVHENNAGTSPTLNILYNGSIEPRMGCTGTGSSLTCSINNCGGLSTTSTGSDGQCVPGTGPKTTPVTFNAGELTFKHTYDTSVQVDGVYDEQTIQGVVVPMELKGRGTLTSGTQPYNEPYGNCPIVGGIIQPTASDGATYQLGACSYNYTPPTHDALGAIVNASNYRFVSATGTTDCSSDSDCGSNICGLAYLATGNKIVKRCGTLIGYTSVNIGICSQPDALFAGEPSTAGLKTAYSCRSTDTCGTATCAGLYACSGGTAATSCYTFTSGTSSTCCGSVNWWNSAETQGASITVPSSGTTSNDHLGTVYANDYWKSSSTSGIVQPQIQWMKVACPTAYSYQFDDPSSSFTCTVVNGSAPSGTIVTNYQVTLCPGGKTVYNPS